jgi:hypothetical protein
MTVITLESLGLTQEELQERVVDKICRDLLESELLDEDGEPTGTDSPLARKLQAAIKKRIDHGVAKLAEKHVLPNVDKYLETIIFEETNCWGERQGKKKLTLREYLVQRADAYLREDVNYEGKAKNEANGYSWSKSQTRLTHLVHQHLHFTIEQSMKEAIGNINKVIVPALMETTKTKLEEIVKTLQVSVKTKG